MASPEEEYVTVVENDTLTLSCDTIEDAPYAYTWEHLEECSSACSASIGMW